MPLLAGNKNTPSNIDCLYKKLKEHNASYSGVMEQQPFVESMFITLSEYIKENAVLVVKDLTTNAPTPGVFTTFELTFSPFNNLESFKNVFTLSLPFISVNSISFALGSDSISLNIDGINNYEDCLSQLCLDYVAWCKSLQLNPSTGFSVVSII